MNKGICVVCNKEMEPKRGGGKEKKYCSKKCHNKFVNRKGLLDHHVVYYIPSIHYCGITNNVYRRMKWHNTNGTDTDDWRVLYTSECRTEAAYHEALFQSVLGINGLNY